MRQSVSTPALPYFLICMETAAVCTGVMSVLGSDEHGTHPLTLTRMRDACLIRAAQIIEIINPRRHMCPEFLNDLSVLDYVQRAVRGNCDRFYEYMGIPFPPLEREMTLYGHRIVMTHGDRLCNDDYTLHRGDVFISGHTHVADLHQEDGVVFCNPGSPSRPRSSEGPTAALLSEEGVFLFSLLDFSTISAIRFS